MIERIISPVVHRSKKIAGLSFVEKWVWLTMELMADDFGVLPNDPAAIRARDNGLKAVPEPEVAEAVHRVVESGLFLVFEHGGDPYLVDPTFQDFQKTKYATETINPAPPEQILAKCSANTRETFTEHHPKVGGSLRQIPGATRRRSRSVPGMFGLSPDTADRGGVRGGRSGSASGLTASETAGEPATAREGELLCAATPDTWFEDAFWPAYPQKLDRAEAKRKADKVRRGDRELVMAGLEAWKLSRQWTRDDEGNAVTPEKCPFVPRAKTWLHNRRWECPPPPAGVSQSLSDAATLAWTRVVAAMKGGELAEPEFKDPLTKRVLAGMIGGWGTLRAVNDGSARPGAEDAKRREFVAAYLALARQEKGAT